MLFYKFQVTFEMKADKMGGNAFESRRALKFHLGDLSAALSEGIDGDKVQQNF